MTKILNIVRALYGYTPETTSSHELSFVEDELLLIKDNSTDDWWYAERFCLNTTTRYKDRSDPLSWDDSEHGHVSPDVEADAHHIEWDDDQSISIYGWIPSNYVQEAECQFIASCLYDFDPDEDDKVSIQAGNQVLVYEAISDPDWWLVRNHLGQYGWVPSNYLGLGSNQNDMIKEQENIFSELASKSIQLIDDSIKKPFEQKAKKAQEEKLRKQEEEKNKKEQEHKKKEEEKLKKKRKKDEKIEKEKSKKEVPKPKSLSPEPIEPIKLSNTSESLVSEKPKILNPSAEINPSSVTTAFDPIPPPVKERKVQPPPILPRKKQILPENIPSIDQPPNLPRKKSELLDEWKTYKTSDIAVTKNNKNLEIPELPPKKELKSSNDVFPKKSLPNRPKKLPNSHKPDPSKTRIWKDKSGMYSVEAQFISISYDTDPVTVVLCKLNGNKVSIPLNKLSGKDTEFVKSKMKEIVPDKKTDESLDKLIESVKNVHIPETKQEQKSLPVPLNPKTVTPNSTEYTESTLANIQQFLSKNSQQKQTESCLVPNNQTINNIHSTNPYQQSNSQQIHNQQAVSLLHVQNIHQQQQLQAQQRLLAYQQQEQQQLKNQVVQLQHTQQQNAIMQMKRQQEQQNALLRQMNPRHSHQMGMIPSTVPMHQATTYQYRNASFSNQMMPFYPQQPQQFPTYNQLQNNPYRPSYPRWNGPFQ